MNYVDMCGSDAPKSLSDAPKSLINKRIAEEKQDVSGWTNKSSKLNLEMRLNQRKTIIRPSRCSPVTRPWEIPQ
jgi:hypothetical protein